MKRFLIFILMLSAVFSAESKKFTVVIDPGHGGSDPGAVRKSVYESHINLAIALSLGEMLSNHADIDVVYTRKTDKKLEPEDRMNTANNANGDIYVSIHVNSAYNEQLKKDVITTSGFEVYIIEQFDKNKERSEKVIKQKGSIISINENNEDVESKFDPNSWHSDAAFKLKQQQIYNQSTYLALHIQREMGDEKRNARGVLQKSLYVTWQTKMPSILVEVGYITNISEREFMTSAAGQKSLARGIYNGIMAYKKDYVGREDAFVPSVPTETIAEQPKPAVENKPVVEQPKPQVAETPTPKPTENTQQVKNQVIFKWQIMTSKTPLANNDERFKNLKNCGYYVQNNIYKYTYGESTDYQEIVKMSAMIKKLFPDAFIIATKNGERIQY